MESDLVTERANPAELADGRAVQGVVELAVGQHEVSRCDPGGMLELGHLQRVRGREVDVVPQGDVAAGQLAGAGRV